MKKSMIWLSILCLLSVAMVAPASAQSTVPAGLSATIGGSVWSDDHFDNVGGSFIIGGQAAVDIERGLFGRVAYHRKNYGVQPLHYIDLSAIEYWYLGNKWSFYVSPVFSVGITDEAGNPLSIGGGVERLWFTAKNTEYRVPFCLLTYADLNFSENQTQIMFGLRLTRPQK